MNKRIITLLLLICMAIAVSACGSEKNYGNTSEDVTGSTFTVGNYVMTIPDGFSARKTNDLYFLTSEQGNCTISIFAADVSPLDEDHVRRYISSQADAFVDENATRYNEKIQEVNFGGTTVIMELYAEESDGYATINTDGSFTDSWYGYTVSIQCSSGSDSLSEDFEAFGKFCASAKYTGKDPRFSFVQ